MKLLLKENVDNLGKRGDIVQVADGYARNYLMPKGLAVVATPQNMKMLEQERRKIEIQHIQEKEKAESIAASVSRITLLFRQRAGDDERLYGSVTNIDIADALLKQDVEIDRKKILLVEPIKTLGSFKVDIKIHPEVISQVTVIVEKEE